MSVIQGAAKKAAKDRPKRPAKKPAEATRADAGKGATKGV